MVATAEEFTVNLSWDAVDEPDLLYYNVYRSETSGSYGSTPLASNVTVTNYMEPALREHLGQFVPEEKRNFFWIGAHYDPTPLYTQFWHWFE